MKLEVLQSSIKLNREINFGDGEEEVSNMSEEVLD